MKCEDALKLKKGDYVTVKKTEEPAKVVQAYKASGKTYVETTYNGFTRFIANEVNEVKK